MEDWYIIGLYNKYGRIPTDFRRIIFRLFGSRFKIIDPILRSGGMSELKNDTWFADQYLNPHESKHSIGEVLNWFDKTHVEFVNSIPKSTPAESFSEGLFEQSSRGTAMDHFLIQLGMLLNGGREGGFFVMIGRRLF